MNCVQALTKCDSNIDMSSGLTTSHTVNCLCYKTLNLNKLILNMHLTIYKTTTKKKMQHRDFWEHYLMTQILYFISYFLDQLLKMNWSAKVNSTYSLSYKCKIRFKTIKNCVAKSIFAKQWATFASTNQILGLGLGSFLSGFRVGYGKN